MNVCYYFHILWCHVSEGILTTGEVITATSKVVLATTKVILTTEDTLKVISATTKVLIRHFIMFIALCIILSPEYARQWIGFTMNRL